MNRWVKFAYSFIIVIALLWIGSWLTDQSVDTWYPALNKAPWNPPSYLFGIVWPILYLMMALAFGIVWSCEKKNKNKAYLAFFTQLTFNLLWSFFFFYLQSPLLALIDLILLNLAILWTMRAFWSLSKWASILLFPYLLWTLFALTLNGYIWIYN
jgi:translocator protein